MDRRYEIPGMLVRDRTVPVPLRSGGQDGETISVFVRELVHPDNVDAGLSLETADAVGRLLTLRSRC